MKKFWPLLAWIALTTSVIGYLTYRWLGPDRTVFLPGHTTSGHYQIELDCSACHTPWMGVKEKACYDCHAAELRDANDSHPKSKFTDPRNADRLSLIKADDCVTCHREHDADRTRPFGVTMPDDYCFHCHQQTLQDRPSHKNFAFNSCASAGCHNYHDNTALYEGFLLKHLNEPAVKKGATVPRRTFLAARGPALSVEQQDAPRTVSADTNILHSWVSTAHARAGVNCSACHAQSGNAKAWSDHPSHTACAECHKKEVDGFLGGKHGMALSRGFPPMTSGKARLPMKTESAHRDLTCASCHGAHDFNTRRAAVDACLACHNDGHSLAYKNSEHFARWNDELTGNAPIGSGVSCATCHLPRETREETVTAQHNQNLNLRPNEKMIRSVCLQCHGLAFSIDSLADSSLVRSNFIGQPSRHVESIDLAEKRQMETLKTRKP